MKTVCRITFLSTVIAIILLWCSSDFAAPPEKRVKSALKSDTIDILNYSIHLKIIHLSNKTISGYTQLTITPKMNNVHAIQLDLLHMTIDSVVAAGTLVPVFTYTDTLLRIPLAAPINISDTIAVKVYYHGMPQMDPSGWGGFYFSADSAFAYNLGVGFEAEPHNFGRVWFPCIDDFIDRATVDCYITVESTKTVVCGGTLMNVASNGDGTSTFYWKMHDQIPSYLVSVAVSNYVPVTSTFNGMNGSIPVKIYVPASDTSHAKSSFIHLLDILSVYESRFGPYRWERVGYVGVPFNSGAMEHATNIAYPIFAIDGSLNYEDLYGHELSHHWFGDLITCASEGDMWINEGSADYCVSIYMEGIYGVNNYKANVKSNHFTVLKDCHVTDGGYFALYGIPSNITYGSTVYKQGADMIHTMRGYVGDSLFFSFIKALMNTYAFKPISTLQYRDFMTTQTGVNMNDFFDGWILSPGFAHFSIDSTVYTGTGNDYMVYVKQKLLHKPQYINSNRIPITFMGSNWQTYTENIEFSGQTGSKLFHLPFTPVASMMDLDEKVSDATTDYSKVVKATGTTSFSNAYFTLDVQSVTDSAFFRVEHNWVAPDPLQAPVTGIFRISTTRYWKIDGIFPAGFNAKGKFNFNRGAGQFENTLLPTSNSIDSLVLLYRANAADNWHIVNFIKSGNTSTGYLTTANLQKGEYTFGIGKPHQSGIIEPSSSAKATLSVYPNPSNDTFNILINSEKNTEVKIFDNANNLVYTKKVSSKQGIIIWTPQGVKSGNYCVYLYENGQPVTFEKVVYVK